MEATKCQVHMGTQTEREHMHLGVHTLTSSGEEAL